MYRSVCLLLLVLSIMAVSRATADTMSYYVSMNGKSSNDGSYASPWSSIESALSRIHSGDTVIVEPGIYPGPVHIPLGCHGTARQPTTIKSAEKWKALILGSPQHGISNSDGCDWVVIDGFEVMGAFADGVKLNGDHNVVRNCWIHNNAEMGIGAHHHTGTIIENNLIEFNGQDIQLHHGIYADGDDLTVRGNIVRHNAAFGIQLYPSIKNSIVANNLIYGQANKPGIVVSCPAGGGKNRIVNNTIVDNDGGVMIWNGDGEAVMNNIIISKHKTMVYNDKTRSVEADYNLCVPAFLQQGSHGMSADPKFVDVDHRCYWLDSDSPAIGAGNTKYVTSVDFWGQALSPTRKPDLGAFAYYPGLTQASVRAEWYLGWPYRFKKGFPGDMPDLWTLPSTLGQK